MVKTFNDSAPGNPAELAQNDERIQQDHGRGVKGGAIAESLSQVHGLTGSAGLAGLHNISLLSSAWKTVERALRQAQERQCIHVADGGFID